MSVWIFTAALVVYTVGGFRHVDKLPQYLWALLLIRYLAVRISIKKMAINTNSEHDLYWTVLSVLRLHYVFTAFFHNITCIVLINKRGLRVILGNLYEFHKLSVMD